MAKPVFDVVVKRDGSEVAFDITKIVNAIMAANGAVKGTITPERALLLAQLAVCDLGRPDAGPVTVERIQDAVERVLMSSSHQDVARAYIVYRDQHAKLRAATPSLDIVDAYLGKADWQVKENSNMSYSLQGLNNHIAGEISKAYWLDTLYDPQIKTAHKSGALHIHDLGVLGSYCVGWDLYDLLRQGFCGAAGKIESAPPKHFRTALGQLVNFIFSVQNDVAGANAISSLDTLLAPFVRYDGLDYRQVKQAMQEFIFNMNVSTRSGGQAPFSNVTLDLQAPASLANRQVLIGGKPMPETYAEFQAEMDMINTAFLEVMTEGDAKGRVFTFPIPTYNVSKDFDWERPGLEKLWEVTAKYGIPYFANFVNSDMSPDDARSMCPLTGDTEVPLRSGTGMHRLTLSQAWTNQERGVRYEALFNGELHPAQVVRTEKQALKRIVLCNGVEVKQDVRHLQPVKLGPGTPMQTITAAEITDAMWLPFNARRCCIPNAVGGTEAGFAVGAYIGDGSIDDSALIYSLNKGDKKTAAAKRLRPFFERLGYSTHESDDGQLHSLRVGSSKGAAPQWIRQFVAGDSATSKRLEQRAFSRSPEFLASLLDGWAATDGGNRGRIYTASAELVNDFSYACGLLGLNYNIDVKGDSRANRLSANPVFCCKRHTRLSYKDRFFYEDGMWWVKVARVEELDSADKYVYCLALENEPHLFQLASGLITHNCRLRLDKRELIRRGGGLFGAGEKTGSIGVVTINMPRLGYQSQNEADFLVRLGELMDIAKRSLEIKRKVIERYTDNGLYPYTRHYLSSIKAQSGKYWSNHFSTIGLVGLNEACINLFGYGIGAENGHAFAERVLDFMRDRLATYQEETGSLYNLEATPAEGTSYRLAMLDRQQFPGIFTEGTPETPYYTNSSQLPVSATNDIMQVLKHQDSLQTKYTGGTVVHVFVGEAISDPNAVKAFVRNVCKNFKLPYFTLTPTFSVCPDCGYSAGEHPHCPKCGKPAEVYSRIVGYIRPVQQWNDGKQLEFKRRKLFTP